MTVMTLILIRLVFHLFQNASIETGFPEQNQTVHFLIFFVHYKIKVPSDFGSQFDPMVFVKKEFTISITR